MKKALLTVTFTILLLFSCLLQPTELWAQTATEPAGSGTIEIPYQIGTLENLYWIAATDDVVSSPNRATRWSAHYIQTADINASDTATWFLNAGWLPIGTNINNNNSFIGSYDGKGYKITGLTINRPGTNNVGLFGHVGNSTATTTISNLGLIDPEIKGARGTGSLVGRVTGQINTVIISCYATGGSVTGDGATGGLVGSFNSYLENPAGAAQFRPRMIQCYAHVEVFLSTNPSAGKDKFGGLAGCAQKGQVVNCYARGPVTASGSGVERVGGLLGCIFLRGFVEKSYSTGVVTAEEASMVGGLVGYSGEGSNRGEWDVCFWDTQTSGQSASAAGLGKTTDDMKTKSTFTDNSPPWDFGSIWAIDAALNDGYPYFIAQPPSSNEASKLVIRTEPVGGLNGYLLDPQPVIEIRDSEDKLITSDNSTVISVEIISGTGGSLGGTLVATATSGVATFENLALTGLAGEDYKLSFTAGEIESVDSEPVQIKVRGWGSLQVSGTIQPLVRPLYYETRTNTLAVTVYLDADGGSPGATILSIHVYNDDGVSPILAGELLNQAAAEEQLTARIALTNGPLKTRHIITAVVKSED
jgi:hypothetical protein